MQQSLLDEISWFILLVEQRSFTAAAKKRRVPTSTVSRAISRLEATLKTKLVHRSARTVVLTEAGKRLYADAAPHIAGLRAALDTMEDDEEQPQGTLRITAPADFGDSGLGDLMVRFATQHPKLTLDVDITPRLVDLVAEGFDVAIRATSRLKDDSALVARRIRSTELHLFASPTYLARHGTPQTPEELVDHACVLFRPRDGRSQWELHSEEGKRTVEVTGRIWSSDFPFLLSVVREGFGIGPVPSHLAHEEVANGRLVRVLPGWGRPAGTLYVVYPAQKHLPKKVAAFRDFLLVHGREAL